VVFSEVMYHPQGSLPEFLEIENVSYTPFDMANWKMVDGVSYEFPLDLDSGSETYSFLKARETIILAGVDAATFRAAYPGTPASVRVFGPWSGQLSNGGGGAIVSLNHGTDDGFGAVTHGSGAADVGWENEEEPGIWTFIAYVYDGAGNTCVYTNGELTKCISHGSLNVQELPFVIGNQTGADGSRPEGPEAAMTVAKVKIFDRELAAGAVENEYNRDAVSFGRNPTGNVDSDGDGLSDSVEALLGTNPGLFDTDGDGRGDGAEVEAGTDPLDPSSFFRIVSVDREPNGNTAVTWLSAPGKSYLLQSSPNLLTGSWSDLNGGLPIPASAPGQTTSFLDDTIAPANRTLFYRVVLVP
jgi:hypothetical protein